MADAYGTPSNAYYGTNGTYVDKVVVVALAQVFDDLVLGDLAEQHHVVEVAALVLCRVRHVLG